MGIQPQSFLQSEACKVGDDSNVDVDVDVVDDDDDDNVENDTVHASGQQCCQPRPTPGGEEVKIVALCSEASSSSHRSTSSYSNFHSTPLTVPIEMGLDHKFTATVPRCPVKMFECCNASIFFYATMLQY